MRKKNIIVLICVLAGIIGIYKIADYYLQYRNFQKTSLAIMKYRNAIKYDSTNVDAYFHMAETYAEIHMPDSAIANYNAVILLNSNYPYVYLFKGMFLYDKLHQSDSAIATFKTAIKIKPDEIESYSWLAMIYQDIQKPDSALKYINIAISRDSAFSSKYLMKGGIFITRGNIYNELKQDQKAISDFKTAVDMGWKPGSKRLKELYNIDYPVKKE